MKNKLYLLLAGIFIFNAGALLANQNKPNKEIIDQNKKIQDQEKKIEEQEEEQEPKAIAQQPEKDTIKFLQGLAPAYKLEPNMVKFANDNIQKGKQYIKDIYAGKVKKFQGEPNQMQRDYLESIIAISWYLFSKAVEKGQGFTGGTIVFEDKDFKVFNFLLHYVKQVNEDVKGGNYKAEYISLNCYGYPRHSTHFPELQNKDGYEQFGIDIRKKGEDVLRADLPSQKRHILFGKAGNRLTFIKMELYGICGTNTDAINHLGQLFASKAAGISRREDMPKPYKKRYKELLEGLPKKDRDKIQNWMKGKTVTLKNIYFALKPYNGIAAVGQFIKDLENDFDNLDLRRGNEVILKKRDIA